MIRTKIELSLMGKTIDGLVRSQDSGSIEKKELIDKCGRLLKSLMIRRTSDSKWFEKPILDLPSHTHCGVHAGLNLDFADDLNSVKQEAGKQMEAEVVIRRQLFIFGFVYRDQCVSQIFSFF